MTPKEAYEEALRRIREAEETEAVELDLSGLKLHRLPPELGRLTSLQSLELTWCNQLRGDLPGGFEPDRYGPRSREVARLLSPLADLTALQVISFHECGQLLSPLADLTSLQDLSRCGFRRFAPLESLLPTLKVLQPICLQVRGSPLRSLRLRSKRSG
jgi:hypothetical protein